MECKGESVSPVRAVLIGRPFAAEVTIARGGAATEDRPYRTARFSLPNLCYTTLV